MEDDVELWIGDYLPTIYEVAMTIHHYSKCYGTQKQQAVVHKYSSAVRKVWVRSFTEKHVVSLTVVKRRVQAIMADYDKRVRKIVAKGKLTMRVANKLWMDMDV